MIPGHGRICDEADVVEFRDMVVIVRDRVRDMIEAGMTLEQVQAARPTRDYDTEYVTDDSFVDGRRVRRSGLPRASRRNRESASWRLAIAVVLSAARRAMPDAPRSRRAPRAARRRREAAPVDLTGYWVSPSWRTGAGAWSRRSKAMPRACPSTPQARPSSTPGIPAKDEAAGDECKAYGAPGLMRVPGRLRIRWQDDDTLEDRSRRRRADALAALRRGAARTASRRAGKATRGPVGASDGAPGTGRRAGSAWRRGGPRRAERSRWRRRSCCRATCGRMAFRTASETTCTEYFDRFTEPDGTEWFTVTTIVTDPVYLGVPFVTTTDFRKERDGASWDPRPCTAR